MNLKSITDGIKKITHGKKRLVVIVQCRMSSTRLPGKALLSLGGKTVLEWNLAAMKKIKADKYYLAVDEASKEALEPIAAKCGWDFYAGSLLDVLDRFCNVIKISNADIVVRATADNPFLFYEAAQEMIDEFYAREKKSPVDYLTFSGLPHGSGVEMFNAHSLLRAAEQTEDPYDHEHVGPALYNHKDKFSCAFVKAPSKYYYPELRTTIDTIEDYLRAQNIVNVLSGKNTVEEPYTAKMILEAVEKPYIKNPVLLIPSVKKGQGTGHFRRCLQLSIKNNWDIYIPHEADLSQLEGLLTQAKENGLDDIRIVNTLENLSYYSYVFTDLFKTDRDMAARLSTKVPVIAIDEGCDNCDYADYVLDILPSINENRKINLAAPYLIPSPENKRNAGARNKKIEKAIVVFGGEDPAGLTVPSAIALAKNKINTTAVVFSEKARNELENAMDVECSRYLSVSDPVDNLKEKLSAYDLVVTHYGFTAFEAVAAGCAVILAGTSPLHVKLSESYGFKCILPGHINEKTIRDAIEEKDKLYIDCQEEKKETLENFTRRLSLGNHFDCPVCRKSDVMKNVVVARTAERTFRRCNECGILYMGWTVKEKQTEYNHAYFFEDYEKQYGKTYLDDFSSIKSQCIRRIGQIDFLYRHSKHHLRNTATPSVLDIGCAMGPFLSAANDCGWQVFGSDISKDAVDYVQKTLNFPAVCSPFPDGDFARELGVEKFDAVTMWYVIEHFNDLDSVLKKISSLIKPDGIFAFSTPSGSGVSAKFNRKKFFEQSPSDHFTIWEIKNARNILERYGFRIMKVVPTGIHPERFPVAQKYKWKKGSLPMKILASLSKTLKLGDTVEFYCCRK